MAVAVHVPRINNNDDEVKLVELAASVGSKITRGQVLASVETDKAVVDVEAPDDGYVIGFLAEPGATVSVGTVLAWLGATADEPVPQAVTTGSGFDRNEDRQQPTAKARALLRTHGLDAAQVAGSGDRLTAADVERHVAGRGLHSAPQSPRGRSTAPVPDVPGERKELRNDQRGMLATVSWQRDHAAPGYLELPFDAAPWDTYAADFQRQHGLLLNPLLPLMAWRLVELVAHRPALNATIVDAQRYEYSVVNLGFTVQAGEVLYLAVVRDGGAMGQLAFVQALIDIQRRAAAHKLSANETQGATIGFSSMARWKVGRHIPVLAPMTAVMVAHTVDPQGQAVLGATYDHRVLHGADVAATLRNLSRAPLASADPPGALE